jgi:NitT/TauT family transport system substrate-binding protein
VRKLCCILLALSVLGISGGFVEGADKVRISVTNPNMSFLPSGVALKKGFFKDDGLEVEIIRMNVPNIITALVTGDIGYTLLFGSVVRGALRGMPMRALASLLDGSTHALVAKPEYKSGKELKGKTVGIGNFGGTDEVAGRMMLKSFGLDTEKDLKFIALGPDRARLAALK